MATTATAKPAVLLNKYPHFDSAGNKMQLIKLLFVCGHTEQFGSLDLGKGWKPRTNRQLIDDHLRITCPMAYKLCRECSDAAAPKVEGKNWDEWNAIARSHGWNERCCEIEDCGSRAIYVTSENGAHPLRYRCWDHAPKDGAA